MLCLESSFIVKEGEVDACIVEDDQYHHEDGSYHLHYAPHLSVPYTLLALVSTFLGKTPLFYFFHKSVSDSNT